MALRVKLDEVSGALGMRDAASLLALRAALDEADDGEDYQGDILADMKKKYGTGSLAS